MPGEGDFAPGFELNEIGGGAWKLGEALVNGPVLLVFFKISCPTCQFTLPFLQRLKPALRVMAISQDDAKGTAQFRERFGISLPTLLDPAWAFPVSSAFGISHVPALFLVEPDGVISMAVEGFSRSHIEELGARFGVAAFREEEQIPLLRPG